MGMVGVRDQHQPTVSFEYSFDELMAAFRSVPTHERATQLRSALHKYASASTVEHVSELEGLFACELATRGSTRLQERSFEARNDHHNSVHSTDNTASAPSSSSGSGGMGMDLGGGTIGGSQAGVDTDRHRVCAHKRRLDELESFFKGLIMPSFYDDLA
jgi:hypothetical protein